MRTDSIRNGHAGRLRVLVALASLTLALPAFATFHLMQIEQVIGGVNGDTSAQAIQLRMRFGGQDLTAGTTIVAVDAIGRASCRERV